MAIKEMKIGTLEEDLTSLGLFKGIQEDPETPETPEVPEKKEDDSKPLEEMRWKAFKQNMSSQAKTLRKKAKFTARRFKSRNKLNAKRWRHSAQGRKIMGMYKKTMTHLAPAKILAIHKAKKRFQMADIYSEALEVLQKMTQIFEAMDENLVVLAESKDPDIMEQVSYIGEGMNTLEEFITLLKENYQKMEEEDLEQTIFELSESLYDILDVYSDLEELSTPIAEDKKKKDDKNDNEDEGEEDSKDDPEDDPEDEAENDPDDIKNEDENEGENEDEDEDLEDLKDEDVLQVGDFLQLENGELLKVETATKEKFVVEGITGKKYNVELNDNSPWTVLKEGKKQEVKKAKRTCKK